MAPEIPDLKELRQVAVRLKQEAREEYQNPAKFIEGSDLGGAVRTLGLMRQNRTEDAEGFIVPAGSAPLV